jgi:hypothetical protein
MESQAIQAFINCPGIIGLALMDGRSQPHFCGIEGLLNYQQREALTQGIQQVVSTTPLEFESFTFCFNRHDAHVHKFADEVILLVVAVPDLAADQYAQSIAGLRQAFDADPQDLVTSLRMAAGTTTLEKQAYWQAPAQPAIAWPTPQPSPEPEPTGAETPPWQDVLEALDQLSDGTARYLGKIVVTNTWRSTRPKPSPHGCVGPRSPRPFHPDRYRRRCPHSGPLPPRVRRISRLGRCLYHPMYTHAARLSGHGVGQCVNP